MTTLTRRAPLPEFSLLRREMDRLFNDFQTSRPRDNSDSLVWMPRADLSEIEDAIQLTLDLPGVNAEDVDVTLEDDTLTISGSREPAYSQSEGRFHRIERSFGRFLRTVQFSVPVNAEQIEASLVNGVLEVTVPKAESSKPRRIEVRPSSRTEITSGDGASTNEPSMNVELSDSEA